MKRFIGYYLLFSFLFIPFCSRSQDIDYVRKIIDTLSSPYMHGRGYVNGGDSIAAEFIKNEFVKDSLQYFKPGYYQEFIVSVNTFPGDISVNLGKVKLKPGIDFVVSGGSNGCNGKFKILTPNPPDLSSSEALMNYCEHNHAGRKFMLVNEIQLKKIYSNINFDIDDLPNGYIIKENKLTGEVTDYSSPWSIIYIDSNRVQIKRKLITAKIENIFIQKYKTQNVIGYIEGKEKPDSFIVFTAHYDHLGQMGKDVYFPGANDNASGVALMLDLARHYQQNRLKYSVVFIALTGEELGLLGSQQFVEDPLFSLSAIKFLINLDLEGTGEEGIKVVNATEFKKEFDGLKNINDKNNYLVSVNPRGKAANSDHYPFYEKGVKDFYIYTLGGSKAYHDIYDRPEALSLKGYNGLFKLLVDFVKQL